MNNIPSTHGNASSGGAPVHLSKEEMRQKIKASLAAKTSDTAETPPKTDTSSKPTPIVSHVKKTTPEPEAPKTASAQMTKSTATRSDKVRQIREAVASHRNDAAASAPSSHNIPPQSRRNDAGQTQAQAPRSAKPSAANSAARSTTGRTGTATAPRPSAAQAVPTFAHGNGAVVQRQKKYTARGWIIAGIILLAVLVIAYLSGILLYYNKFLPKTYVNQVNIGGMTAEEATQAILDTANEMGVTFIPREGDPIVFKGSSFGCQVSLAEGALDEAASENHALWFTKLFSASEYTAKYEDTYSEDALASLIAAYDWGNVPPTDAEVVQNADGTFSIQPEDDGNMVDTKVLSDYTIAQMRAGNNTITMEDSGCYQKAAVTAESLEGQLALYNKIGAIEMTYDMTDREEILDPVGTEVLDHETIMEWISVEGDEIVVDRDQATAWIQENIADKYDTLVTGYTRTFESTMDGTIELPIGVDGIYGWKTNVSATVDKLIERIQNGESATVEPVYKVEGFRMNSNAGVTYTGDTYIEIDICNQKLWYYVNGELYLESDVVTGTQTDPTRATPPGAYKVWSRESPRKLGTYEVQGYETWVTYWMPVTYTGIGLHDLSRSAYGGDIYMYNGSHGCINLPLDIAKQIYDKVTINTPVLIIP